MKIFLDTADLGEIRRAADANLIDGVTTNPSLMAKVAAGKDPKEIYREICEIVEVLRTSTRIPKPPTNCWPPVKPMCRS